MADPQVQHVSTIISAKWICPVRPHNITLDDHSIVIDQDRIIDIIETKKVASLYQAHEHFQLHHHIVTPGLINAHTHAAMNLFRGFADDQPLHTWLNESIWPLEKKWVTPDFVYDGTLIACAEMLKSGVTTFNEMYFYPEAASRAIKQSGMRANIGLLVMDYPSNYANDGEDYLMKGLEARDGWRDEALITSSIAPHAPYSVSDKTLSQVLTYANQLNLTIHMHVHETEDEIQESLNQYQLRPIERLNDGSASNNKQDLLHDMQLASLLAKGLTKNPAILNAKSSLEMITINAAKALGLDDHIGSIEKGKYADLTVFNMDQLSTLPIYDPMSHLIYAASREEVSHVWVNGILQYEEGHFASMDIQVCKDIALRWQLKLKQSI